MVGWIKLYKKILNNPTVMKDAEHLAVWVYLLLKCSHPKFQAYVGKSKLDICEGQCLTGRKQIADDLKINESKITRILSLFENEHQIRQETSNRCRIISIEKWEDYQTNGKGNILVSNRLQNEETHKNEQQNEQPGNSNNEGLWLFNEQHDEQQVNNKRTTDEQQVNTKIKTIRPINNNNNIYIPPKGGVGENEKSPNQPTDEWKFDKHTNVENTKHILFDCDCIYGPRLNLDTSLSDCIHDWMEYKDARKPRNSNHYANEKSILSLVKKIIENCDFYGTSAVIGVIEESMSNNYQGIVWDLLSKRKGQGTQINDWSNA